MPAFNFKKQFVPAVESGQKCQTIREKSRGVKGDTAYLYTGMRTKQCRKLGEGLLTAVFQVEIGRNGCGEPYAILHEDGEVITLAHNHLNYFAQADGFKSGEEMVQWFSENYSPLPFKGFVHEWVPKQSLK